MSRLVLALCIILGVEVDFHRVLDGFNEVCAFFLIVSYEVDRFVECETHFVTG